MKEFTFLTCEQVFGKNALDIIKKYGTKCAVSDFSILLNGSCFDFSTNEDSSTKTGFWWTQTPSSRLDAYAVTPSGDKEWYGVVDREIGCRPAIKFSSIKSESVFKRRGIKGVLEFTYGEIPQTVVNLNFSKTLEMLCKMGRLEQSGKSYTTDSNYVEDYGINFKPRTFTEYIYNNRKYIRFVSDDNCVGKILSSGTRIAYNEPYWVRVEPIIWLVDEKADIALSKNIILSGIKFHETGDYSGNFEETDIYNYLNNIFAKEIVISNTISNTHEEVNNYGFDLSTVSEEDIIRGAIESDISVFLHGKSSDGKSQRIKKLDPDCEIIYMRNATPDSLNGKSVYDASTGSMIDVPPTWYQKIVDKCSSEPDKIHLVFFDELTNALPSMQGMAFNIILDREVNGKWKLPKNARIVAAGNDFDDSLAANKMAEPLFNRFAHVYINTGVEDWLKWAMEEDTSQRIDYNEVESDSNIHPSIISYIEKRDSQGYNVLRTPFTGVKPNADPRKWELASKVLYKTNKPEILRSLIGEDLTNDFINYLKYEDNKTKVLKL